MLSGIEETTAISGMETDYGEDSCTTDEDGPCFLLHFQELPWIRDAFTNQQKVTRSDKYLIFARHEADKRRSTLQI